MLSPARYLLVVLLSLIGSFAESEFKNTTQRKANAAFVILARNSELNGVLQSIKMMEDRFNRNFGYPYVFLNEQPFTSDFIKWIFLYTSDIISTKAEYGVIPPEHWYQPEWIDEERAAKGRMALQQKEFFFRHPLMLKPGVEFFCDLDYDPFLFMRQQEGLYGFTISLYEFSQTITTLWQTVKGKAHRRHAEA
ncbi:alpha 1,2-mannosyltransferase 2.4.1 [Tulasnella sp. 425]|nr:alpha 1,2-mannosyltransferase 2.4.1 [Tulasnella sp. 425]